MVWATTAAVTAPSPVVSPINILTLTAVSGSTCATVSVTPLKVTLISCTSVTPERGTVMVVPEKVGVPAVAVPAVTLALPLTTLVAKLQTKP